MNVNCSNVLHSQTRLQHVSVAGTTTIFGEVQVHKQKHIFCKLLT